MRWHGLLIGTEIEVEIEIRAESEREWYGFRGGRRRDGRRSGGWSWTLKVSVGWRKRKRKGQVLCVNAIAIAIAQGLFDCRRIYFDAVYPPIQEAHSLLSSSLRNWDY